MYRIIRTDDFERAMEKLPGSIRLLCETQITLMGSDWRDSRLHIKKLREQGGMYSFRITRHYRALFYFDKNDNVIVFDVDHRKDAYRKIRR